VRYDQVISLVTLTYTKDELQQQVSVATSREVFANEFTLSAAEFYEAGRAGMKPEREFEIRAEDYEDEALAEVGGVAYQVVRTIRKGQWVRLVLERKVGNTSGDLVS
jgi:SPP1 family predicted phage head-tail adaptor